MPAEDIVRTAFEIRELAPALFAALCGVAFFVAGGWWALRIYRDGAKKHQDGK